MDEKQRREQKLKLKELRKELEEKIKGIIPEALKAKESFDIVSEHIEDAIELDEESAKKVVEALLFATSRVLTAKELSKLLKTYTPSQIAKMIESLKSEYENENRGFRINVIAGGYEVSTLPQFGPWIAKLEKEKKAKQASLAALETLAILAYKQPITRVEIEEIRGVDVSGVISTLCDKGFIKIVGRKEVPGRPLIYGTTDMFLEHFGLKNINDLPDIEEIKSLVEDTIKREELLRKENIVTNTDGEGEENSEEQQVAIDEQFASLADKYDEIAQQIAGVKVKSERQISDIIKPKTDEPVKEETEKNADGEQSGEIVEPPSEQTNTNV